MIEVSQIIEFHVQSRKYPANRKPYVDTRSRNEWRGTPWGRMALRALTLYLHTKMTPEVCLRDSRYQFHGIEAKNTYDFLKRAVPEFFAEYYETHGKKVPDLLPIKRIYAWSVKDETPKGDLVKKWTAEYPPLWCGDAVLWNEANNRWKKKL